MTRVAPVGIIANPASGKDIRRLVAHGSTFDNGEKVNIVRRILLGMNAVGVRDVYFMPDAFNIVGRAMHGMQIETNVKMLKMDVFGDAGDTRAAAKNVIDLGVSCIVTLGGDGTNRAVVSAVRNATLLPVSTGTNNVFPSMVEGTLAGFAAGSFACGVTSATTTRPLLEVYIDGQLRDVALADVVRSSQTWTGSRAVWKADDIQEVVTSHVPLAAIGVCGLGSTLYPDLAGKHVGIHAVTGPSSSQTLCAIGPGLPCYLSVSSHCTIEPGQDIQFESGPGTLALDGEREIELRGPERVTIRLIEDGPRVIEIEGTISEAARRGLFSLEGIEG